MNDSGINISKIVVDGFHSVPQLLEFSTPELLKSEIDKHILSVEKQKLDGDQIFETARNRALELASLFSESYDKEKRKIDRENQKQLRIREQAEKNHIAIEAKIELEKLIARLLSQPMSAAQKSALEYFKHIYIDGKRDYEISNLFEGSSRDQRYQWKRRSIDMVEPFISDTAKKYISERTKRKFASFDIILKYADVFLFKTLEKL